MESQLVEQEELRRRLASRKGLLVVEEITEMESTASPPAEMFAARTFGQSADN